MTEHEWPKKDENTTTVEDEEKTDENEKVGFVTCVCIQTERYTK